jgi:hypothetical protein
VVCALATAPAAAQETKEPDVSKVRVRLGPVSLDPTIELTHLGMNRLAFGLDGTSLNARERPGYEIDVRADR